jgi:hypothetical protein
MVAVGSLLVLLGYNGPEFNAPALIPGVALILGALIVSFVFAFGSWRERPSARGVSWLIPATATFYVLCAGAALLAGGTYAAAAIGAGLIPLTAATLLTASARAKTVGDGARRRETTSGEHTDPFPAIGIDDSTPLGDTSEHSGADRLGKPDPHPWRHG